MSLLVALAWSTFTVLCVVVLSTDPSIPHNVTAVRICKGDTFPPFTSHTVSGTGLLQLLHAGLPPFIDEAHKKNMMRNNLLRLVTVFVVIIFVWTSQSRITRYRWLLLRYLHIYTHIYRKDVSATISIYRRRHNQSYFLSYRQNIATIDQTIYYAYLKVSINIEIYLNDIHYYCL